MKNKMFYISIGSFIIIAFFLVFEHRVHLYGFAPYAFFIVFAGLHLFMHAGHGGHGNHKKNDEKKEGRHHG